MEWQRARVSQKPQVTIPQRLFEQAGVKDEVEFGIKVNNIICPVRENIGSDLADLIKEGLTDDQLQVKFREKQANCMLRLNI